MNRHRHKGQCLKCKVAYSWTGGPPKKSAFCPRCKGSLSWVSWDDKVDLAWEELPKCADCGAQIARGNKLCGECACEDDCAPD
jgi:hypothetical protein